MADVWAEQLEQFHRAITLAVACGGGGLVLLLVAAAGWAPAWLALPGVLLGAGALGFVFWVHRRVRAEGRSALAEYRSALALLASLQETSEALTDLVAALRTSSVDGVRVIDGAIGRVARAVRGIPLLGNPLTDVGFEVVTGISGVVVEGANHAARLALGIEEAVRTLDVSAMERHSKSVRRLAAELREQVDTRPRGGRG